jgi:hypothetical protein
MKDKIKSEIKTNKQMPFYLRFSEFTDSNLKAKKHLNSKIYATDLYPYRNHYKPILLKNVSI